MPAPDGASCCCGGQPRADEIETIQERFGLPALAVEDAQEGHQRPKLEPVGWVESAGTGEVYTYSVHFIGLSKAYKGDPPHVVALIDLVVAHRLTGQGPAASISPFEAPSMQPSQSRTRPCRGWPSAVRRRARP